MTESMATGDVAPLVWPPEWLAPTSLQKVLVGMPFIGLQRRVYRSVCEQLRSRGPEYRLAWDAQPVPEAVWVHWSRRVTEEGLWPIDRFIPSDPFALVFWDHRFDGLVVVELLSELAEYFGIEDKRMAWDRYRDATYGAVLDSLRRGAIERP